MTLRALLDSLLTPQQYPPTRRSKRVAGRRLAARRLLAERLEDRRLLAFNILAEYSTGPAPSDLALARIDAGSRPDLVISNNSTSLGSVRLGNTDGTFASPQSTGVQSYSVATGDLTGDGIMDLAAISTDVVLQAGNGNGTFQSPQSISLPPQIAPGNPDPAALPQSLRSIATGDLNGDGKLDLVVGGQTSFEEYYRVLNCGYYSCGYSGYFVTHIDGYVNVLMGNGSGGFAAPEVHYLGRGRSPAAIATGDLSGDGNADVLVASSQNLVALLGDGAGSLDAPIHSGSGSGAAQRSVSLGDLDRDGNLDTITYWGNSATVQKGQGNGRFEAVGSIYISHSVDSAVVGDVNGDGLLDLVAVGSNFTCNYAGYYGCYDSTYSGTASVVLGNGQGAFSLPIASPLGTDFNAAFVDVALADLTGDGLPEMVTIENSTGLAIIAGNDGQWVEPVALSISSPSITEGNHGMVAAVFTVTLASPSPEDVSVDYATADLNANEQYWYYSAAATAGVDYMATTGTLTIPAGQTSGTIVVPVIGDRDGEPTELFFVDLSNPSFANIDTPRAVGTIVDDEPYVSMEYYSTPAVTEGNTGTTPIVFTILLSTASDVPVTVNYFTTDGDASAGSDYQASAGTITFAPGETSKLLTVQVIGDWEEERDEYFIVNLTGATNASTGNSPGYGYIINDDAPPQISIGDATVTEGNSGTRLMTFSVRLSNPSGYGQMVDYATANGTATTSNGDYTATSGSLYFAPGETMKTITVTIKGDTKKEKDERFYVRLSGASGGEIIDGQGVGTILNDDGVTARAKRISSAKAVDAAIEDLTSSKRSKRIR